MNKKIGFIGYGNMASAIACGIANDGLVNPKDIFVMDVDDEKNKEALKTGFITLHTPAVVASSVDVLVLAVKPYHYVEVIAEIKDVITPDTIIVSIAAGLTIETLESYFDTPVKLVRTMPNTPALVGIGMTAIMPGTHMRDADIKIIEELFKAVGKTEIVDEDLIEAVIVTSGSSPAYIYMMIEAMVKGGMAEGMTRAMATNFVTQAVMGAAQMVISSDELPNKLRDNVCSPNGTTIEAVKSLQKDNFEEIVMTAMKACAERSREMAKE